jgi:hypothetical protein
MLHGGHGAAKLFEAMLQAGSPGCKFRNILSYGGTGQRSCVRQCYILEVLDVS